MGGWGSILVAGLLAAAVIDARGEDASRCGSGEIFTGHVIRIIDGRSFVTEDGREIRLAALDVPTDLDTSLGQAARTALEAVLTGGMVELRAAAATPDRYGRIVAHASVPGSRPVSHALLSEGHARVSGDAGDAACTAELLSQERVARAAKLGLWGDPRYAVIDAGNLTNLVAGRGRFAVVEGKVWSVRAQRGTIYVNFGRRWSQSLTVTISKRQERIFAGAGLSPSALENKQIRVRGFVELRNGPRIEASRPEQIEIAELNRR